MCKQREGVCRGPFNEALFLIRVTVRCHIQPQHKDTCMKRKKALNLSQARLVFQTLLLISCAAPGRSLGLSELQILEPKNVYVSSFRVGRLWRSDVDPTPEPPTPLPGHPDCAPPSPNHTPIPGPGTVVIPHLPTPAACKGLHEAFWGCPSSSKGV